MTVRASDGVHLFSTQFAPLLCIEVSRIHHRLRVAQFTHHARHIRTLTRPTGSWLHVCIAIDTRITRAQNLAHVIQSMLVATRSVVMARESIASPQHHHLRTLLQHIHFLRRVILRLERSVLSHRPRLVLTRIVGLEPLVLSHNTVLKLNAFVVKHTCHFSTAFHQRRNE